MVSFEWDIEHLPGYKAGLHIFQILCVFVAWCLEISVFANDKSTINGQNGWTFAVCFLSLPAWIYLIGAPRYPRTRRLAEPHAMVTIDALFTVLWLSAFATQAAYNTANLCGTACSQSKAIVALGVFATLLWAGTTFLSIMTLRYYDFNGTLPGYESIQMRKQNIDPDKAAFSTAPHDEYAPVGMNDHDNEPEFNATPYGDASVNSRHDAYGMTGAGAQQENPFDDRHDEYQSTAAYQPPPSPGVPTYAAPTAHDAYDDGRAAQFPAGNYNRIS